MKPLRNLTLEISPKPLVRKDEALVTPLFDGIFRQWYPLAHHAAGVSLLWWLSDGTDILEYDGDLDRPIEWAIYLGFAHKVNRMKKEWDPHGEALHSMEWHYRPDPITLTYGDLQRINMWTRHACRAALGCDLTVGITFDPGSEFCKSPWRYERHPELLIGTSIHCIDATARLRGDNLHYAGFPDGVPEGIPFGRFLGRQARNYMTDLGYDYIWFSNSFGFGRSPYAFGGLGEFFDGTQYKFDRKAAVRDAVLEFWQLFREECPDHPIECRGTDFSAGLNMVSHATPYEGLYGGNFNISPPPNTPWPALTGNHGIALAGYMSQIAPFPGERFPYRFYASDPWWLNTPWTDRFHRSPRDIYLPTAVTRLDAAGQIRGFDAIEILSIDTTWGELPEQLPDELQPHFKRALRYAPDAPAPTIWVYPFAEYARWSFEPSDRIAQVLAGDLLIEEALNQGLSLNCVTTTDALVALHAAQPAKSRGSVLVSPVPEPDTPWEQVLLAHVAAGGKLLVYGSTEHAGARFLELLGLAHDTPLSGEFDIAGEACADSFDAGPGPTRLIHDPVSSGGPIREVAADCDLLAAYRQGATTRAAGTVRRHPSGGAAAWVRGTSSVKSLQGRSLPTHDLATHFGAEALLRHALGALGWTARISRHAPDKRPYSLSISRHRNGFVYAAACTDPSLTLRLGSPLGAPLLPDRDTRLVDGLAAITVGGWLHEECRVFVEQSAGVVQHYRACSMHPRYRTRYNVSGLLDATVRLFPQTGAERTTQVLLNPNMLIKGDPYDGEWIDDHPLGRHLLMRHVTGTVTFAWSPDDVTHPIAVADCRV